MKILHLADLHIGKMLYGYSLIEDQRFLFEQIYTLIASEQIQVVMIAGDVYDRAVPGLEAVNLLNEFLDHLINVSQVTVLLISGNHDSSARLNFGSSILEKKGLYIATEIKQQLKPIVLQDEYGPVNFYLLPYFKRSDLKEVLNIEERGISLDALLTQYMLAQPIDPTQRNLLMTHTTCIAHDHEEVGGIECVSSRAFSQFDYTALGHLHGCHRVNASNIYYAGSPLKYSIDEVHQKKGLVMICLQDKGFVQVEILPVHVKREVEVLEDTLEHLLQMPKNDHYVFLKLKDKTMQLNAADRAREVFDHLLGLTYTQLEMSGQSKLRHDLKTLSVLQPLELFASFYEDMTQQKLPERTAALFHQYFKEAEQNEN